MVEFPQPIVYPKYGSSRYGYLDVARTIKWISNNNIWSIIGYPNGQVVLFGCHYCNFSGTLK
jgi:hypothetical protein